MAQVTQSKEDLYYYEPLVTEGTTAESSVMVAYYDWLPNRKEAVERLNKRAQTFDEYHVKANVGSLVGSVVSGGSMLFGLPLSTLLGTATSVGSSLAERAMTRSGCSDIQKIIDNDVKYIKALLAKLERFEKIKKKIADFIETTPFTREELVEIVNRATILCQKTAVGKVMIKTMEDLIENKSPVFDQISKASRLKILAASTTVTIVKFGCVAATLSLCLDASTVYKVAEDMANGSKSETGAKFRELSDGLKKGIDSMKEMIQLWTESD